MKYQRIIEVFTSLALTAGVCLLLSSCEQPTASQPAAAASGGVKIRSLPAQLAVGEKIEIAAEVQLADGTTSQDVLWAFLDDEPSEDRLATQLDMIWHSSVTPLQFHFYTTRAVYSNNRLMGRYPGKITLVAASRQNPDVRSRASMQIVAATGQP